MMLLDMTRPATHKGHPAIAGSEGSLLGCSHSEFEGCGAGLVHTERQMSDVSVCSPEKRKKGKATIVETPYRADFREIIAVELSPFSLIHRSPSLGSMLPRFLSVVPSLPHRKSTETSRQMPKTHMDFPERENKVSIDRCTTLTDVAHVVPHDLCVR